MWAICPRCGVTATWTRAGRRNAVVQAPVAATTASASMISPSSATPAARPDRKTSSARPVLMTAPRRDAARARAPASRRPSTRLPPPMSTRGLVRAHRREQSASLRSGQRLDRADLRRPGAPGQEQPAHVGSMLRGVDQDEGPDLAVADVGLAEPGELL